MTQDLPAKQVALVALQKAKHAETRANDLRRAAVQANEDAILRPSSASAGRRASLAREAYNAKMSATVARARAAFALIAEQEGARALTANEALQKVTDAQMRSTLVTAVKGGQLRRNIMLQAADAAEEAFSAAPGLPASMGGGVVTPPGAQQVTVGRGSGFRPMRYNRVADEFYPSDIRAAASSLKGFSGTLGFEAELNKALNEDSAAVEQAALNAGAKVAAQEPGAANLAQQVEGLLAQLKRRHELEHQTPVGIPWLHVAAGAVGFFVLSKVLS